MNYKKTSVYDYLSYMEDYLKGDLSTFHILCEQSEEVEKIALPDQATLNTGSMYGMTHNIPSSTTTSETTIYPEKSDPNIASLPDLSSNLFRLTIPITLTLFAIVDCVGYLSGENTNALATQKNFNEFFRQSSIPVSKEDCEFLNRVFRQGLTHVYFPKLGLGISYHSKNQKKSCFSKQPTIN